MLGISGKYWEQELYRNVPLAGLSRWSRLRCDVTGSKRHRAAVSTVMTAGRAAKSKSYNRESNEEVRNREGAEAVYHHLRQFQCIAAKSICVRISVLVRENKVNSMWCVGILLKDRRCPCFCGCYEQEEKRSRLFRADLSTCPGAGTRLVETGTNKNYPEAPAMHSTVMTSPLLWALKVSKKSIIFCPEQYLCP